ncbi:DUF697 domain-containing protein [Noviherbaspirillum sp. CPCC 100848]|uniref:DUF697 domain-containing protein n=1 Tax=Noviherbaspirillum album TaxID=3080276 RepID=A0ABU6JAP1_9BURK|nr:DUF697 domain-containing protein [Noviherbaspirillum sp. CPCC 100848]MEC4720706.1 DUF697 domain-containing protein [Noviherbaspirillum sp. CPCC 100848]
MKTTEPTDSIVDNATAVADAVSPGERHNEALHTIKNHTITAMGVGILPVPGLDLLALTGVQLNLLRKLGALYGYKLSDETGKKLLGALLSGYLPLAITAPVASVLKFIPGVGIAAGVLAQSTLAGATTYAVGKLFLQHFESGGNFLDFKPAEMGSKLRQQVEEGKQFIKKHAPGSKTESV